MKCPKCGYERKPKDNQYVPATECPACGIVYAKSDASPSNAAGGVPSMLAKPSPVDPQSLKKARDRVELRLRRQLEAKQKDERHALTLERAKRIAALEAERRKARQAAGVTGTKSPTPADAPAPEPDSDNKEPILDLMDVVDEHIKDKQPSPPETTHTPPELNADTETESDLIQPHAETTAAMTGNEPEIEPGEKEHTEPSRPETNERESPKRYVLEETAAPKSETEDETWFEADAEKQDAPRNRAVYNSAPQTGNYHQASRANTGVARLLPVVAWLILIAGVVGAVLSWTTLKSVEANVAAGDPVGLNGLPLGLLLGFAYLATGVLGFAFFWVSSMISRELKDIRRLLLTYPMTLMQPPGNSVAGQASDNPDEDA